MLCISSDLFSLKRVSYLASWFTSFCACFLAFSPLICFVSFPDVDFITSSFLGIEESDCVLSRYFCYTIMLQYLWLNSASYWAQILCSTIMYFGPFFNNVYCLIPTIVVCKPWLWDLCLFLNTIKVDSNIIIIITIPCFPKTLQE